VTDATSDALREPGILYIFNPRGQDQDHGGAAPGEQLTVQGGGFVDGRPTAYDPCSGSCPLPTKISVPVYDPAHPGKPMQRLLDPDGAIPGDTLLTITLPADAVTGWIHVQLGTDDKAIISPGIYYDIRPDKIDFFGGGAASTELNLSLTRSTLHFRAGGDNLDCGPLQDYYSTLSYEGGNTTFLPLSFGRDGSAFAAGKWIGFSETALGQSPGSLSQDCQNRLSRTDSGSWITNPDFKGYGVTRVTPGGARPNVSQAGCGGEPQPYNQYGGGNYSVGDSTFFQCNTFASSDYTQNDTGWTPSTEADMVACPSGGYEWRNDNRSNHYRLKSGAMESLGLHSVDTIFLPRNRRAERDQCSNNWKLNKPVSGGGETSTLLYSGGYASMRHTDSAIPFTNIVAVSAGGHSVIQDFSNARLVRFAPDGAIHDYMYLPWYAPPGFLDCQGNYYYAAGLGTGSLVYRLNYGSGYANNQPINLSDFAITGYTVEGARLIGINRMGDFYFKVYGFKGSGSNNSDQTDQIQVAKTMHAERCADPVQWMAYDEPKPGEDVPLSLDGDLRLHSALTPGKEEPGDDQEYRIPLGWPGRLVLAGTSVWDGKKNMVRVKEWTMSNESGACTPDSHSYNPTNPLFNDVCVLAFNATDCAGGQPGSCRKAENGASPTIPILPVHRGKFKVEFKVDWISYLYGPPPEDWTCDETEVPGIDLCSGTSHFAVKYGNGGAKASTVRSLKEDTAMGEPKEEAYEDDIDLELESRRANRWADRTGVPMPYINAEIAMESGWKKERYEAYRYEPFFDANNPLSDCITPWKMEGLNPTTPRGPDLLPPWDINFRSIYAYARKDNAGIWQCHRLPEVPRQGDVTDVTIREILVGSNGFQDPNAIAAWRAQCIQAGHPADNRCPFPPPRGNFGWCAGQRQNWDSVERRTPVDIARLYSNPKYDKVANTTVHASYSNLQIMYWNVACPENDASYKGLSWRSELNNNKARGPAYTNRHGIQIGAKFIHHDFRDSHRANIKRDLPLRRTWNSFYDLLFDPDINRGIHYYNRGCKMGCTDPKNSCRKPPNGCNQCDPYEDGIRSFILSSCEKQISQNTPACDGNFCAQYKFQAGD
jgi:hypothetical protein